jgi:uncharacterized spore protein YtfJ
VGRGEGVVVSGPLTEVLARFRESAAADRVYAPPVERDGVTVIPAAAIRGGGGGGGDTAGDGGGGFGLSARPVGAWVVQDGEVRWSPVVDVTRIALGVQAVVLVALLVARSLARRRRPQRA